MAEVDAKKRNGEVYVTVTFLTLKKHGKPLLLEEMLNEDVKHYLLRAVREGGGVITTATTMASATAIVQKTDRNLLK